MVDINSLSKKHNAFPRYLKGLLISLLLMALSLAFLRWTGFQVRSLADETPKALMFAVAFILPSFALALDVKYLKSTLISIDRGDRLPLGLLLLAQVFWFYSSWLTIVALISYVVLVLGRFLFERGDSRGKLHALSKLETTMKQRAKAVPPYLWSLVALFFLNAIGLLWQTELNFPNTTDKYILYVLLPLSLLCYKPRTKSVYQFARFALPIFLALLSIYLIYAMLFQFVYFEDFWAFVTKPLSRIYQPKIFPGDTYLFYSNWLEVSHPSYSLLALLPYFLVSFFAREKTRFAEQEELVFVLLTFFFVLLTHLRYGLYYIVLMIVLLLCKPYIGAVKELIKRRAIYIVLGFSLLVSFLYQERALFVDEQRLELYQLAIEKIKEFPILGQGTGAELELFKEGMLIKYAHAHNLLLSMMLNFGVIGLLWLIVFIASLLYKAMTENEVLLVFCLFLFPMFIIDAPFTLKTTILQMLMSFVFIGLTNSKLDGTYAS